MKLDGFEAPGEAFDKERVRKINDRYDVRYRRNDARGNMRQGFGNRWNPRGARRDPARFNDRQREPSGEHDKERIQTRENYSPAERVVDNQERAPIRDNNAGSRNDEMRKKRDSELRQKISLLPFNAIPDFI
jgi:hypothetical protein